MRTTKSPSTMLPTGKRHVKLGYHSVLEQLKPVYVRAIALE